MKRVRIEWTETVSMEAVFEVADDWAPGADCDMTDAMLADIDEDDLTEYAVTDRSIITVTDPLPEMFACEECGDRWYPLVKTDDEEDVWCECGKRIEDLRAEAQRRKDAS